MIFPSPIPFANHTEVDTSGDTPSEWRSKRITSTPLKGRRGSPTTLLVYFATYTFRRYLTFHGTFTFFINGI